MRVRQPRVQPVFRRGVAWSRRPCRWRTGHVASQKAQTWSANQDKQGCLRLVARGQVAQSLLDQLSARKPRGLHARSIAPGRYFAASLRSIAAIVLSHAMVMVAPASVTFVKPIVNCSTDDSAVRTVIGVRSRSNFGS